MIGKTLVRMAITLLAAPLAADAQPIKIPRIGYLGNGDPTTGRPTQEAFRQGLRELGWIEGHTVPIEYRWAERNPDRLPALAAELVHAKVDVIVLSGTRSSAPHGTESAPSSSSCLMYLPREKLAAGGVTADAHGPPDRSAASAIRWTTWPGCRRSCSSAGSLS